MYGVTALLFFVIAGIEALFIRLQLATPNGKILSAQTYNELFTTHGTTMVIPAPGFDPEVTLRAVAEVIGAWQLDRAHRGHVQPPSPAAPPSLSARPEPRTAMASSSMSMPGMSSPTTTPVEAGKGARSSSGRRRLKIG